MAATLDGLVKETGAVFEAKFMLPWSFSEEAAAEKHMAQLQHNMLVAGTKKSVLSIINGGGKWVELSIEADPIYQTILIAAEKFLSGGRSRPAKPRFCSIASLRNHGLKLSAWSI
jgi:predicted phage-related endonuclease